MQTWKEEEIINYHYMRISPDFNAISPRERTDRLGTLVCWHRKHKIGEPHKFGTPEDFLDWEKTQKEKLVKHEVYLYDHGGLALSLESLKDRWSGEQIGWIYADKPAIRKHCGYKVVGGGALRRTRWQFGKELEEYTLYLNGDVWGYEIIDLLTDTVEHECWGFFGRDYYKNGMYRSIPPEHQHLLKSAEWKTG
jgi:hypothetical protein